MAWQQGSQAFDARTVLAEESARAFMAKVYRWMFVGLAVTAGVSMYVASHPAIARTILTGGLFYGLIFAELGLVWVLTMLAPRVSGTTAGAMFLAYSAMNGATLSIIFFAYQLGTIYTAFLTTAGAFLALSIYGTVTKRDLNAWASFLMIGLFGVIIAGVVNLFLRNDALDFVWSCACVVVFAGLTAYDTQKLRQIHANSGYSSAGSLAVSGALSLYLDFINLFLALLRILGRRRN
jgi:FtsH-binding integral membrane protein